MITDCLQNGMSCSQKGKRLSLKVQADLLPCAREAVEGVPALQGDGKLDSLYTQDLYSSSSCLMVPHLMPSPHWPVQRSPAAQLTIPPALSKHSTVWLRATDLDHAHHPNSPPGTLELSGEVSNWSLDLPGSTADLLFWGHFGQELFKLTPFWR